MTFCSEIHNQLPSAMLLTDIFSYLLQKCDFSAVTSAVFLPHFLFFFLSPASLSCFILFICKVSMTVNCLFEGGVEAFRTFLVLLEASFEQSSFLMTPLSVLLSSTSYSSSSSSFSSQEEVDSSSLSYCFCFPVVSPNFLRLFSMEVFLAFATT